MNHAPFVRLTDVNRPSLYEQSIIDQFKELSQQNFAGYLHLSDVSSIRYSLFFKTENKNILFSKETGYKITIPQELKHLKIS